MQQETPPWAEELANIVVKTAILVGTENTGNGYEATCFCLEVLSWLANTPNGMQVRASYMDATVTSEEMGNLLGGTLEAIKDRYPAVKDPAAGILASLVTVWSIESDNGQVALEAHRRIVQGEA